MKKVLILSVAVLFGSVLFTFNATAMPFNGEIGFVGSFNAIDNVMLPLIYERIGHVKKLKRAEKMLKVVGLEDRQYYRVNQLSGGQVQRVAIARALINKPAIILADEPTGNLDSESGKSVMELLSNLHKEGNTIVIVTHDDREHPHIRQNCHRAEHHSW